MRIEDGEARDWSRDTSPNVYKRGRCGTRQHRNGRLRRSSLTRDVRQETKEASALDSHSNFACRLRRRTRAFARLNASVGCQKFLKSLDVFVVNMFNLIFFELDLFSPLF